MNQVIVLEVTFAFNNVVNTIYPVILKDQQELILIDCGYPHFLPLIKGAAEAKGIDLGKVTKIVITHHDFDHMGALAEWKSAYPHLEIVSSESEEKYISGKEKSLRLQQAEALYDLLPESEKAAAENFHELLRSITPVAVDLRVKDHELLPWCGGTEIIATPGHMPGHISLYVKASKTLLAGDALVIENDQLGLANPQYTLDLAEAKNSIRKLLTYEIEKIICYHGGIFTGNCQASLQKIAYD